MNFDFRFRNQFESKWGFATSVSWTILKRKSVTMATREKAAEQLSEFAFHKGVS